jgi:hypothetical protein
MRPEARQAADAEVSRLFSGKNSMEDLRMNDKMTQVLRPWIIAAVLVFFVLALISNANAQLLKPRKPEGTSSTPPPPPPPVQQSQQTQTPPAPEGGLAITTEEIPDGMVGTAYSVKIGASGGTAPYTFSIKGDRQLPGGLILAKDGTISGTPSQEAESVTVTVEVKDSKGATASEEFPIAVDAKRVLTHADVNAILGGVAADKYDFESVVRRQEELKNLLTGENDLEDPQFNVGTGTLVWVARATRVSQENMQGKINILVLAVAAGFLTMLIAFVMIFIRFRSLQRSLQEALRGVRRDIADLTPPPPPPAPARRDDPSFGDSDSSIFPKLSGFLLALGLAATLLLGGVTSAEAQTKKRAKSSTPAVYSIRNDAGIQGSEVEVTITGRGLSDTEGIEVPAGITVSDVKAEGGKVTAKFAIDATAGTGPIEFNLVKKGGAKVESGKVTFTVLSQDQAVAAQYAQQQQAAALARARAVAAAAQKRAAALEGTIGEQKKQIAELANRVAVLEQEQPSLKNSIEELSQASGKNSESLLHLAGRVANLEKATAGALVKAEKALDKATGAQSAADRAQEGVNLALDNDAALAGSKVKKSIFGGKRKLSPEVEAKVRAYLAERPSSEK